MNEEIIQMAKEAGLHRQQHNLMSNPVQYRASYDGYEEHLERFYNLAVAAEREACAKICDAGINNATDWDSSVWDQACENRATAIRARGQA